MKSTAEDKEFISAMEKLGSQVVYLSAQDFSRYWAEEKKWMETIVKATGLKTPEKQGSRGQGFEGSSGKNQFQYSIPHSIPWLLDP